MDSRPLGSILLVGILAGIAAGLIVAAFHFVATEPIIEQAIALEESHAQHAGAVVSEPVVSRPVQRVGLVLGMALFGISWSLLFAGAYALARRLDPRMSLGRRGFWVAGLGYWAVALMPLVKYPANPPGVGDPETIAYRQLMYVTLLVLGVLGGALVFAMSRQGARSRAARTGGLTRLRPLGILLLYSLVLILVLPGNPDEVAMPLELVNAFRVWSLVGLTLFWAALGALFVMFSKISLSRASGSPARRPSMSTS